jgi:SAM-dependent methyltransferase
MPTSEAAVEATPFDDGALYDIVMGSIDFDLGFYLGLARAAKGPILDLCCGTGRILLPALQAGLDVDGVDLSAAMLATLSTKAKALGLQPRVYEASMTSFRLDRSYALIMIPCNAIVHSLTTQEQLATLTTCREHLQPGGLLAFDTFFPGPAIIFATDNCRVLEGEIKHPTTGLPVRMYDNRRFDRVEQLQHSLVEVEMLDAAANVVSTHRSRTTTRWIYKYEMQLLLRVAGFARWQISGDFAGRPLVNETDAMIVKAWKGD